MQKKCFTLGLSLAFGCAMLLSTATTGFAKEVGKGEIPAAQLESSYKKLDWGAPIWDVQEAIASLDAGEKALWVDTRPASFFGKGSVRGAVDLPFDKTGAADNTLTAESLAAALEKAGLAKGSGKVIFFCQGPTCHRSYNASFVAIKEWGYAPEQIIWFRAGYPDLLQAIKTDDKLKRKAKKYISDEGVKDL